MSEPAPAPNFDRVARLYRWAEYLALGPLLQQTRLAHIDKLLDRREALLFGDGDGRFLARMLTWNPTLRATAVDTSAAMLRLLSRRCRQAANRLTTLQASALQAPIPSTTDLIVTHFFLDCLVQDDVDALARRIAAAVRPDTLWLVSDFAIPDQRLLRTPARLYISALYFSFRLLTGLRVTTLPDPQSALAAAGFRRIARRQKLHGLLYSELWVYEPGGCAVQPTRHNPTAPALIHSIMAPHQPSAPQAPLPLQSDPFDCLASLDPLPAPEPIAPSLDEPDPGVFHHEPGSPKQQPK